MNQEYKQRVARHLEAGGDPKYVNIKRKAEKRHHAFEEEQEAHRIIGSTPARVRGAKENKEFHEKMKKMAIKKSLSKFNK